MKKLFTLLALIVITTINAQAPQGFNYQATVRNSAGVLITNQNVLFKFNIMLNSQTSLPVYSETHQAPTDDLGQVNIVVGTGTPTIGTFSAINWANGSYFLGIELNTGANFVAMGTTQLLSVPYALYANTAGSTSSNNTGLISPTITTNPVANIVGTTATFSASISNVNINQLSRAGFVYSLNPNPIYEFASGGTSPFNALEVNLSSNTFTFDSAVQGYPNFSPNTLHYVRAFVITENNTIVYGNEISFVTAEGGTIVDIASGNADFSILVRALERTNLVEPLDGSAQFTVFAPTNAAFNTFFASLGAGVTVENVDVVVLRNILLNHVIGTEINSVDIPAATYVSTLSQINTSANSPHISMFIQKSGSVVTINGGSANGGATVTTADLDASNGVIHVVSNVIAIPTIKNHAIANPNFSTLTSLLVAQGLVPTLDGTLGSPFTVFAPVNTAFDSATLNLYGGLSSDNKTAVLLYHVVGGVNVRSNAIPTGNITTLQGQAFSIVGTSINDAGTDRNINIILTDVQCSNGIVHAIDKVLLPNL